MDQLPLYDARITDLCPGHFVSIRRIACGQDILIPPSSLFHGLRLPPNTLSLRNRETNGNGLRTSIKFMLNWRAFGVSIGGPLPRGDDRCLGRTGKASCDYRWFPAPFTCPLPRTARR